MSSSSPLFNNSIFKPLLTLQEFKALKKFTEKSESIESFIARTIIYASRTTGTSVSMNTCIFVLKYLEQNGYLRSAPFKNPCDKYNGEVLLNYFPTESYKLLLDPDVVLPEPKRGSASKGQEEISKENLEIEVTGKRYHLMKSAASRKKDFDLSYTDVKRLVLRKTCFYTGLPFSNNLDSPFFRTIDRVDANQGYVKGNVVACIKLANEMKNNLMENGTGQILPRKSVKRMLTLFLTTMGNDDE